MKRIKQTSKSCYFF